MTERFIPRAQEIYRHFKGELYQVIAVAEHTETGEKLVIYQAMYGDFTIYARPLEMFVSPVDRAKYPDATQEFRFQLQGPDAGRQLAGSIAAAGRPGESFISGSAAQQEALRDDQDGGIPAGQTDTAESGPEPEEPGLDPLVLEFLDARTYEQRLNVLAALHHRITNEMITTMSLCCDIEVEGDDVEQRYEELKQCLIMKDRFEIKRLV
ncbi:MAG: DUF1653 domain-containing protein [Acetatifactor sp.]|nr:DUF1653 domain-containing protein [Acetatifactor sp.]